MDERESFLTALQLGDAFFPSGAFAHSSGLEAFVADGLVPGREDLVRFVEAYLLGLVAACELVLVGLAHSAAAREDFEEIRRLDALAHAMKFPRELRQASMQMGRQTIRIMKELYASAFVRRLSRDLDDGKLKGDRATMFGAACGGVGVAREAAFLTYVYTAVGGLVSAGVRLIPLGHTDGQRAIQELKPVMTRVVARAETLRERDIASFAPALEIRAMQHESLPVRLFKS